MTGDSNFSSRPSGGTRLAAEPLAPVRSGPRFFPPQECSLWVFCGARSQPDAVPRAAASTEQDGQLSALRRAAAAPAVGLRRGAPDSPVSGGPGSPVPAPPGSGGAAAGAGSQELPDPGRCVQAFGKVTSIKELSVQPCTAGHL